MSVLDKCLHTNIKGYATNEEALKDLLIYLSQVMTKENLEGRKLG